MAHPACCACAARRRRGETTTAVAAVLQGLANSTEPGWRDDCHLLHLGCDSAGVDAAGHALTREAFGAVRTLNG